MAKSIVIVLDETDSKNPIFVEIEKISGESIRIGERVVENGLTHLHITVDDILKV